MWYIEQATPYGYPKLPESVRFMSNDGITVEYVPRRFCKADEYEAAPFIVCSECGAVLPDDCTVYYCWSCGAEVLP